MNEAEDRVWAIFAEAVEIADAKARVDYLAQACGTDIALRQEVEELLQAESQAGKFLPERPAGGVQSPDMKADAGAAPLRAATEKPGDRIGCYKLLQKIGEGGCGVVYMAEQETPVKRKVGLKVIKLGMDTKRVVARFEAERQAQALMDHPNIAKVLDAGATDTGRPYFVMELVRGTKITNYCDQQKLSMHQRLDLFIQICQAVQHAHQKGIIHRDLKPSNILVTERDGQPVPKVIDFGIAKATGGLQLTDKTLFTAFEQFIGTPAYMSPEQARLGELDIDTRSDIYSLGVLLYELLTGKTPFDTQVLLAAGLEEMCRTIREKQPPRPSTRLTTMTAPALQVAAGHRGVEALRLVRLLRGDLDWIIMKCLEKDRRRRYETANGLARDIQRYLNSEPVVARPPSRLYEFQKSVRRHKVGFAATAGVIAALVCGLTISSLSLVRERAARLRAVAAEHEQSRLRVQAQQAQGKEEQQRRNAEAQERKAQKNLYAADMTLAYEALEQGNLGHARRLLAKYAAPIAPGQAFGPTETDPRGWEWRNLWQRSRGDEIALLYGHSNLTTFAAMLSDGRTVVSASKDRTLRFWDLPNRRLLETVPYPNATWCGALSSNGRWLAIGGEEGYWSLWDPTHREPKFARTNTAPIKGVAFSSDSQLVAVANRHAVEVWKLSGFELLRTIIRPNGDFRMGIAFSPDSKLLAYSEGEEILATNVLMLCELATGITNRLGTCEVGHAFGLAFSADGRIVISAERSGIWLWDIASHLLLKHLIDHQVVSIALSPNGRLLASVGGDQALRLWDTQSWQEVRLFQGHELEVHWVTFSPDGTKLLSCGKDEVVRVWNVEPKPTPRQTYSCPPGWVSMPGLPDTPRQLRIQIGTGGRTEIGFLDLMRCEEVGTQLSPIPLRADEMPDTVSADLRRLAIHRVDDSIEIWDTMPFAKRKVLAKSPVRTQSIALSATGRCLALEAESGHTEILDLERDKSIATLEPSAVLGGQPGLGQYYPRLSFWAGDTRFVRVTGETNARNELVEVLLMPGGETRRIRLTHKDGLNNFCVSTDGEVLATSAWDGQIKVWSVRSGAEIHTLSGQLVGYISVAFAPDGSRLAAGAWDGSITMWDTSSWSQVAHWKAHAHYAARVCFLDGGSTLMTRGSIDTDWGNWETHIWRPPSLAEIRAADEMGEDGRYSAR